METCPHLGAKLSAVIFAPLPLPPQGKLLFSMTETQAAKLIGQRITTLPEIGAACQKPWVADRGLENEFHWKFARSMMGHACSAGLIPDKFVHPVVVTEDTMVAGLRTQTPA